MRIVCGMGRCEIDQDGSAAAQDHVAPSERRAQEEWRGAAAPQGRRSGSGLRRTAALAHGWAFPARRNHNIAKSCIGARRQPDAGTRGFASPHCRRRHRDAAQPDDARATYDTWAAAGTSCLAPRAGRHGDRAGMPKHDGCGSSRPREDSREHDARIESRCRHASTGAESAFSFRHLCAGAIVGADADDRSIVVARWPIHAPRPDVARRKLGRPTP